MRRPAFNGLACLLIAAAAALAHSQRAAEAQVDEVDAATGVPPVLLSAGHAKLCRVNVGDEFPAMELPQLASGGAGSVQSLAGPKATVVVFWTADRWMSAAALADLARLPARDGVAIVGVAVNADREAAQQMIAKSAAKFTQLLDADRAALAQVGEIALPRVYVLDGQRRIAWFDIEYSESTRRELQQTLAVLTGENAAN